MSLINIKIDTETALNMLMNRFQEFTDIEPDDETYKLFESMYKNYLEEGTFSEIEFDVMNIVDNDWINDCRVISKGDEDYAKVKKLYKKYGGACDISCETCYAFIEAANDDATVFLVRGM